MNARIDGPAGFARQGIALVQGNALVRLAGAAVLAAFCVLALAAPASAQVPDNRDVKLNPEDPVSPEYGRTLNERDRQRLDDARRRGASFLATFQGAGQAPGESGSDLATPGRDPEDGGAEWSASNRGIAWSSERPRLVYETVDGFGTGRAAPGDGLTAMVGALLESWTRPPSIVRLRYATPPERGGDGARASAAPEPSPSGRDRARLPLIAPGQGFYARTLYAVDSDYPGPVVLELLQPPLAGAVAHGGFERVGQRLVLRLGSLTWRGRTFPVDAWAVDPQCACFGIEGEVDRHFLSRVLLPAAARFAEGFLTAAAMPARTLTLQDGAVLHERGESGEREALHAGAGAAAQTLGDILMADAPRETTVRIPRDTPLVVMMARAVEPPPSAPAPDLLWRERADAGN